jgi:hypothetical protein
MKPYFVVALTGDEVNNIIRSVGKEMTNGVVSAKSSGTALENITLSLNPPIARVAALVLEKAREIVPKGFDVKVSTIDYQVDDKGRIESASVTFRD